MPRRVVPWRSTPCSTTARTRRGSRCQWSRSRGCSWVLRWPAASSTWFAASLVDGGPTYAGRVGQVTWQPSLLDDGEVRFDASYDGLRRIQLDSESWVDHCPGWLSGADAVMAMLLRSGDWNQRTRRMYENQVLEPRLTAGWSTDSVDGGVPSLARDMAAS